MGKRLYDTIVAIATPLGEGAISVIRVSGASAIKSVASRFNGKLNLEKTVSHTAHFGRIVNSKNETIDEVICTVFRAPMSFTGEDTVEVSCHGGTHVTRRVLECLIETGLRPAEPGEFTQRAFLNGKIDLSQAEAIADLIQAQSDKAQKISLEQLEGVLSKQIHMVREELVNALGLLELELDFTEEHIELTDKGKLEELFRRGLSEIDQLLGTYKYGKVFKDGVRVALVGAPNAGKSRLLNAMLKKDRAIVTDIPGTTRDYIEEKIMIDGLLFRMIDTAGLRKTEDPIEIEGVSRTKKIVKNADIIVLVHDITKSFSCDEIEFIESVRRTDVQKTIIFVNNKKDLLIRQNNAEFLLPQEIIIETSALNSTGIEELKEIFVKSVLRKTDLGDKESATITNERHYYALLKAKENLSSSLNALAQRKSNEFIAIDLRMAIDSIGQIIGDVTTEEILNNIFSKFCIGK